MTEQMTEAELYDVVLSGDRATIQRRILDPINGTHTPTAEEAYYRGGQERADAQRQADQFWERNGDLQDEPQMLKGVLDYDKRVAEARPDMPLATRLNDYVEPWARKTYGTEAERVIRAMKLQRNPNLRAEDLQRQEVEADEFDREHAEDISATIENMRRSRVGVPLSEIRRRRVGGGADEQQE